MHTEGRITNLIRSRLFRAIFLVLVCYFVLFIPVAWAESNNSTSYISDDLIPGSVEGSVQIDVQIEPTAGVELTPEHIGTGHPGETVTYTHNVKNWGNFFDTFNITYTSSQGWIYKFYWDKNNDGVLTDDEELKDTNGDGIIDTGEIEHCGEIKIFKRVFIPGDAKLGTTDTMIMEVTSSLNPEIKSQAVNTTHCENGGIVPFGGVLPFTGIWILPLLWGAGLLMAAGSSWFSRYSIMIVRR